MNLILSVFETILQPNPSDRFDFAAKLIPGFQNYRLAKDKLGNPSLLLSTLDRGKKSAYANIKLNNIDILFNVQCDIQIEDIVESRRFTVIRYIGNQQYLKEYFLKLCSSLIDGLGQEPNQDQITYEINHLIDLLRFASEPPKKAVQGLWAELLVISLSSNPAEIIRSWHNLPEEKYDFANFEERLEVKSSSNGERTHAFSIEQLNPPVGTKVTIASILVRRISNGKSVEALKNEIIEKLEGEYELVLKINRQIALILGNSISDINKIMFDWHFAKESLRFYDSDSVPKILINNVPELVTDIHFKSNISQANYLDPSRFTFGPSAFRCSE